MIRIDTWPPLQPAKLYLFEAKKIPAPTIGAVRGKKLGEIVSQGEAGMRILAQGGFVEVSRLRLDDGAKIPASEAGIPAGTVLGVKPRAPGADRDKERDNGGPPPPS